MAELKHRTKESDQVQQEQDQQQQQQPTNVIETSTTDMNNNNTTRKQRKPGTARRGLRSLGLALAFPLSLSLLDIYFFGSSTRYRNIQKPFYFPPLWALHLACLANVFLSGVSAWLVWAEGGFHRRPNALILYLGQLLLSLVWYPVVFGAGAIRVGLVLCAAVFGLLLGCSRVFKKMNPIAGDLIKPCLLWAVVLAVVNFRLVYR